MQVMDCLGTANDGSLTIGGLSVNEICDNFGTPLYIYDENKIRENCKAYLNALNKYYDGNGVVSYASKAFCCVKMCKIAKEEGMGLDVVSGGELYTALKADFPAGRICFHGNNKTDDELKMAVENNVGTIIVDNEYELSRLNAIAQKEDKVVNISFRIKPGIDAHTHDFIMTGQIDSKFGVALDNGEALEFVEKVLSMKNINLVGVHCHIGSQIFDIDPFVAAAQKMMGFIGNVKEKFGYEIQVLNLGGGFGIKYLKTDDPVPYDEYIKKVSVVVKEFAEKLGISVPKIYMEPGRSIVGNAGITVYTVGAIKDIKDVRTYVSVDGGMADNPRYIMYDAEYEALLVNNPEGKPVKDITLAGKCCESGDILIKNIKLPEINSGERIAVLSTGAYNYSMASNYNRIPRPAVVMVRDRKAELVVKRETYEDIIKNDL